MRINKLKLFFFGVVILGILGVFAVKSRQNKASSEEVKEMIPVRGSIRIIISSTGTVLPKNRLEIKPPVNGRVEKILVQEGDKIKTGQNLAIMSSTERAALLDAARGKGEKVQAYWEDIYKPIPLPSPIEGEVIVATTQPGQAVTTSDAVIVLSDNLIIRAQVDETDIGKVSVGMGAIISLDAYPDTKIRAKVDHIYYESQTVNNVTIYKVDLVTEEIPLFFRSGMNASVDFIIQDKKDILIIPVEAVNKNGESYCLVKQTDNKELVRINVQLGISDDKNIEVISGVKEGDRIVLKSKKYVIPKAGASGTNPFMPSRRR